MEVNGYIALDEDLRGQAVERARRGLPSSVAARQAIDSYAAVTGSLDDPTLAKRAADVRQVGRRVLAHLHGDRRCSSPRRTSSPWPPRPTTSWTRAPVAP